ncbi:MAG: hypothetical protein DRJ10_16345, partial [Bacteroidetes bacterium]
KAEARKIKNINIIEDLMPFDEYQSFFNSIDAFVFNGYRQMAMRAVYESLRSGVKVYLNDKNVVLAGLKKEGFLIYNMDDFENNLSTNNLHLSEEQISYNSNTFEEFRQKYNLKEFHTSILGIGNA